jgi:hypothetical protein
MYCGAVLPEALVEAAQAARQALLDGTAPAAHNAPVAQAAGSHAGDDAASSPTPTPVGARAVLVLDLAAADPRSLAAALGVSLYEAGQRCRRGGPQLLRVGAPPNAAEQAALATAGARWRALPEADVRAAARPQRALGGGWEHGRLRLRVLREESLVIAPGELVLGLRGTLQRAHAEQANDTGAGGGRARGGRFKLGGEAPGGVWRRGLPARKPGLEPTQRLHLHRRDDPRPIELDPGDFEFGDALLVEGAPWSVLSSWTATLLAGQPLDDGFKLLAPVLTPANPETGAASVRAVLGPRAGMRAEGATTGFYDNLEQFRFYSAWRGLFERHTHAG